MLYSEQVSWYYSWRAYYFVVAYRRFLEGTVRGGVEVLLVTQRHIIASNPAEGRPKR